MADGIKKNWRVVKTEVKAFWGKVKSTFARAAGEPSWVQKIHILSGIRPDYYGFLRRTLAYRDQIVLILAVLVIIGVSIWLY